MMRPCSAARSPTRFAGRATSCCCSCSPRSASPGFASRWRARDRSPCRRASIWFAALAGPARLHLAAAREPARRLAGRAQPARAGCTGGGQPAALSRPRPYARRGAAASPAALALGAAAGRPLAAVLIAMIAYGLGAAFVLHHAGRCAGGLARRRRPAGRCAGGGPAGGAGACPAPPDASARAIRSPAPAIFLAVSFALTLAGGALGQGGSRSARPPSRSLLLPSLAILLLASRLDAADARLPALCRAIRPLFSRLRGFGAAAPLRCSSRRSPSSLAGAGLGALLRSSPCSISASSWSGSRGPGSIRAGARRSVDFQLQLEFIGLLAIAFLLPPLAVAAAGWRLGGISTAIAAPCAGYSSDMRIEVRGLSSCYRGDHRAVDGVSFAVEGAGWTGLVGANGSGKTSLLRALAGRIETQERRGSSSTAIDRTARPGLARPDDRLRAGRRLAAGHAERERAVRDPRAGQARPRARRSARAAAPRARFRPISSTAGSARFQPACGSGSPFSAPSSPARAP